MPHINVTFRNSSNTQHSSSSSSQGGNGSNGNAGTGSSSTTSPTLPAVTAPTTSSTADHSPSEVSSNSTPLVNPSLLAAKYLGQKRHSLTSIGGHKLSVASQNQHRHSVELSGNSYYSRLFRLKHRT